MGLYSQYVSVDGIWTFEARGSGRNGSGRSNLEGGSSTGMRGRLGAGMDFADLLGGSFGMDVSYDGLGRTHYETLTITLGYGRRF